MSSLIKPAEALEPTSEAIRISQYEVLLGDIAEATAAAQDVVFDYASREGNKAARSYVAQQRKLRGRIEAARKDAKAWALAYGRTVDSQARELTAQVDALITPHQQQIDALVAAEQERVARHQAALTAIWDMGKVPFGATTEGIAVALAQAKAVDVTGLEEFEGQAASALLTTIRSLEAALEQAQAADAEAAEQLARLEREAAEAAEEQARQEREAAERAEREAAERAEREAAERARLAAEAEARAKAEAEAQAAERIATAERKADEAEAEAAAAQARAAELEARAMAAETIRAAVLPPVELVPVGEAVRTTEADQLHAELLAALAGLNRAGVADALLAGTLHRAVVIDWGRL